VAVPFDRDLERFCRLEPHDACPPIGDLLDDRVETGRDVNDAAGAELSTGVHERFILAGLTSGSEQEHFGRRAGIPMTQQSRAKDARGIQDDGVAGWNEVGKIRKVAVLERA
jgi:hypothetical protein